MKVYISRNIPETVINSLKKQRIDLIINADDKALTQDELIKECKQVDILLCVSHADLNRHFFNECKHLKGIALTSAGYDYVDLEAASEFNIPISNTPEVLNGATADTALLLLLATSRIAFSRAHDVRQGNWVNAGFMENLGVDIEGKTLGIYGLGRIGIEFAKRAKAAFNMSIVYHNRKRNLTAEKLLDAQYLSFEELLQQSDVVSVHSNLSPETQYRFDKTAFQAMKKTAIFINTARGKVHNELDLIDALQQGEIWGAGLDVCDPEPMLPTNPLLQIPTVCILPHIGSATVETRTKMAQLAANNIIAVNEGNKMPQLINQDIYNK